MQCVPRCVNFCYIYIKKKKKKGQLWYVAEPGGFCTGEKGEGSAFAGCHQAGSSPPSPDRNDRGL